MTKNKKIVICIACSLVLILLLCLTVSAASSDVAGAVEDTWNYAKSQIKQVVNNVVFPVMDLVLAVCFFVKICMAYMDYRKQGRFDFTAPAILFATLLFSLTAPMYLWEIVS